MEKQDSVLVVGGAGYIGSHTAKALKLSGFNPIVIDNLSTGFEKNVKYGPFINCDMSDFAQVKEAINKYKPQILLHFAACIEVGEGQTNPIKFYENNVANSISLFKCAIENGVKNIVFSSTCATYGVPEYVPLDENHNQNPINVYGRTKLMIEWILKDLAMANGINYAILRYFNASGADIEGELGEEHQPESHLIPNVIAAIMGKKDKLHIFGDDYETPDGTAIRDYIHVSDLAAAHVLAGKYLMQNKQNLILNLGTGNGYSVKQIIDTAEEITNLSCPIEYTPRRDGDSPTLYADTTKANEILGFKPQQSDLKNIINTAYNFHKSVW